MSTANILKYLAILFFLNIFIPALSASFILLVRFHGNSVRTGYRREAPVPGWWRNGAPLGDEPPSPALETGAVLPVECCLKAAPFHGMAGAPVEGRTLAGHGRPATYKNSRGSALCPASHLMQWPDRKRGVATRKRGFFPLPVEERMSAKRATGEGQHETDQNEAPPPHPALCATFSPQGRTAGEGRGVYPPCFSRNASAESTRKSSSAARRRTWSQSHQASAW